MVANEVFKKMQINVLYNFGDIGAQNLQRCDGLNSWPSHSNPLFFPEVWILFDESSMS